MGSQRTGILSLATLLFCVCGAIADADAAEGLPPLKSVVYVSGLSLPVDFVQDPMDDGRQFVVEQGGRIRVVYNGVLLAAPFLNVSAAISTGGERGLLGLAFPPDYTTSRRFYIYFTNPQGHSVVARFKRSTADPSVADPASRFDLRWSGPSGERFIPQPYANHNGGHLEFGPDGYLYLGLGDGGSQGDPQNRAQNPATLLGKMLRLDVSVGDGDPEGYAIPATNPFAGGAGPVTALPEIWAFGLRNPWQFSFDLPGSGALIIGDVGQGAWEEIDYQPPGRGGLNYGWRNFEGSHVYDNSVPPAYGPLTFPIVEYGHTMGRAVTGGAVCRTCNLKAPYEGRYFYADSSDGRVWSVHLSTDSSGNAVATDPLEHTAELSGGGVFAGNVTAMAFADPHRNLYYVNYGAGTIVRIETTAPTRTLRYGTQFTRLSGSDIAVFRPGTDEWFASGAGLLPTWGIRGDIPVPGSYAQPPNGDRLDRVAVFRPSTGAWYIPDQPAITWGAPGDIPVPAYYTGSAGFKNIAVYRPSTGTWYIRDSAPVGWGLPGDVPVPTDYDGNGADDIAVYRPSNGTWYVRGGPTVQWGVPGDIPVPADYDNDGAADYAVFRPSTGQWLVRGMLNVQWGQAGDVPVPLDLDQDGRAELVVYRRSTSTWYSRNIVSGATGSVQYGLPGDVPLGRIAVMPAWRPGDGDGDLRADLTAFRPPSAEWFTSLSSTGFASYTRRAFGMSTDTPVARDYDGDGIQDPAVFRPSTGAWYALLSSTGFSTYSTVAWGAAGDVAVPADYDGDGRTDVAVFRPSQGRWYLSTSATGTATIDWGLSGDIPVPADYDGDGRADLAVFRPSSGRWYVRDRFTGAFTVQDWGLSGDRPVPADYDGDGRTDLAVFRPSEGRWHILASSAGTYTRIDWGLDTDVPMPLDYDGDGRADIAVYRPSTGRWYVRGLFEMNWGLPGDVPVPQIP